MGSRGIHGYLGYLISGVLILLMGSIAAAAAGWQPLFDKQDPVQTADLSTTEIANDCPEGGSGILLDRTADRAFPVFQADAAPAGKPVAGTDGASGGPVPDGASGSRGNAAPVPAAVPPGAMNYFWNYYDSLDMRSWILMGNQPAAAANLSFQLDIGNSIMPLGDLGAGSGVVPPGMTLYYINPGLADGPAVASSLTNAPAIVSQRSLMGNSFEEVLGVDMNRRSSHFYWTWYDMQSPGFRNWIIVNNPDPVNEVNYEIRIGGAAVDSGVIPAGSLITPTYPGRMGGPVEVITDRDVLATQRVLSNNNDTSFNEMPGIPAEELASDYLWTWYDMQSPGYLDWVLIANPHTLNAVNYEIKIGGVTVQTGSIPPLGMVTPTFPGAMDGPVEVIATGTGAGSGNIIATQRIIAGPSFGEVPGFRRAALDSQYFWTWYDMTSGFRDWVLIANPDPVMTVNYEIRIGGVSKAQGSLAAGERVTPTFPGEMGGPVEVLASAAVIVSQRVTYNGHFNEVPGSTLTMIQPAVPALGACARR